VSLLAVASKASSSSSSSRSTTAVALVVLKILVGILRRPVGELEHSLTLHRMFEFASVDSFRMKEDL